MKRRIVLNTATLLIMVMWSVVGPAFSESGVHAQITYHLLIIAPDDFVDELQPLKRFKDATARPTILVSLTQVYNSFDGDDEAEQVKNAIASYATTTGIDHVMLVGDVDRFPVRWIWWGLPGQEGWGASDLYYADLFKTGTLDMEKWDLNDNQLYGETEFMPDGTINNDQIDYLPDVAVGRVPASTGQEVRAYVEKVIAYEMRTRPTNTWFQRAALYTGTWLYANDLKDAIGDGLADLGFTLIKRYADWTGPTPQPPPNVPTAVLNDINAGVGLVNYVGHGSTDCLTCLGLCSTNLSSLSNDGMLPVVFAAACDTSFFSWLPRAHPYRDVNGVLHCGVANGETLNPGLYPHPSLPRPAPVQSGVVSCGGPLCTTCNLDHACLGESFLFGNPLGSTGAIAYLGERSGGQVTSQDLDRYFFEAYHTQGLTVLGDMWTYMIEQYFYQHDLATSHTWQRDPTEWSDGHVFTEPQKLVLFGDPSLVVGGAFAHGLAGFVWDSNGGPWFGNRRYRVVGYVSVPTGEKLTVYQGASVLFEDGSKISAWGTDPGEGLILNATTGMPVYFLSLGPDPQSAHVVHGMKILGQVRVRDGGQIKLY